MKLETLCIHESSSMRYDYKVTFFCNTLDKDRLRNDLNKNNIFKTSAIIEAPSIYGYKSSYEVNVQIIDRKNLQNSQVLSSITSVVEAAVLGQLDTQNSVQIPETIDIYPNGKYSSKAITDLAKKCGISYSQVYAENRYFHKRVKLYYVEINGSLSDFFTILAKALPKFQSAHLEKNAQWVGGNSIIIKIGI